MSEPEGLEGAFEGRCPECGSTLPGHAEIAVLHGHGAAEHSDRLRTLLAEQMGIDPETVTMSFTPLSSLEGSDPEQMMMDFFAPFQQGAEQSGPKRLQSPQAAIDRAEATMNRHRARMMSQTGLTPMLVGFGALMAFLVAGFMMSLFVIDRMVKRLAQSFPFWNQDD